MVVSLNNPTTENCVHTENKYVEEYGGNIETSLKITSDTDCLKYERYCLILLLKSKRSFFILVSNTVLQHHCVGIDTVLKH